MADPGFYKLRWIQHIEDWGIVATGSPKSEKEIPDNVLPLQRGVPWNRWTSPLDLPLKVIIMVIVDEGDMILVEMRTSMLMITMKMMMT